MQLIAEFGPVLPAGLQSGARRVVERAQHAGDVAQRRVLGAALLQTAQRLALEVEDVEVVAHHHHLAQVHVAVQAGLQDLRHRRQRRLDQPLELGPAAEQRLDVEPGSLRQCRLLMRPAQRLRGRVRPVAHQRLPVRDVGFGDRLGPERRIVHRQRERLVQLADARAQGLRQGDEHGVQVVDLHLDAGRHHLELAQHPVEIVERERPAVALVAHEASAAPRSAVGSPSASTQFDRAQQLRRVL